MKKIKTMGLIIITLLFLIVTVNAKTYDSLDLQITYENEMELKGAKEGLEKVKLFFTEMGYKIDPSLKVKILFIERVCILFNKTPIRVHTSYDPKTLLIEITQWSQQKLLNEKGLFNITPISIELYHSLIVHEITHAILHSLQPKAKSINHEYIAYIVQIYTMGEGTRKVILNEYKSITAFENCNEYAYSMFYDLSPFGFAIAAYLQYLDTDELFRKIVKGEIE